MVELSRRGFIGGLVGLVTAPAIVRAASLMPVKVMEPGSVLTLDMIDHLRRLASDWPPPPRYLIVPKWVVDQIGRVGAEQYARQYNAMLLVQPERIPI